MDEKRKRISNVSSDKLNKTTIHCERQFLYPEAETEIVQYIEFNRKLSNPISTWALLLKLYKIALKEKIYLLRLIKYLFIDY